MPFSTAPAAPVRFALPEVDRQAELEKIKQVAGDLTARGGTAIYDSLVRGYQIIGQQAAAGPDRFHSIVLMTDGGNQNGSGLAEFERAYGALPQAARQIPVFTVLFGEGNQSEMDRVAALTGGRVFDGRSTELSSVFQEIRGYQ